MAASFLSALTVYRPGRAKIRGFKAKSGILSRPIRHSEGKLRQNRGTGDPIVDRLTPAPPPTLLTGQLDIFRNGYEVVHFGNAPGIACDLFGQGAFEG